MAWAQLTSEEQLRIGGSLHSAGRRRFSEHAERGDRFAHTSADAAMQMIAGRQVWMRRANAMNHFAELEYGVARLDAARASRAWAALCAALESARPGASEIVEAALPQMIEDARSATFLTALCRHPAEENDLGRLSMWRAYGGPVGVCLVLSPGVLLRPSSALQVFNHPVGYHDDAGFQRTMLDTAGAMLGEIGLLRRLEAEELAMLTLNALRGAILCTKHPGFAEEREWRLIHSPRVSPSDRVPCELRRFRDTPQPLHVIPLQDIPQEGMYGLEPRTLVERIIVGPCTNPDPVREAMIQTLRQAGAPDAEHRVVVSAIPLRR